MSKSIKLSKEIMDIIKKQGFHCNDKVDEQMGEYSIVIYRENFVPSEDWSLNLMFDGTAKSLQECVRRKASEFDIDDETKYWVLQIGQKRCLKNVDNILKYAKWKKQTLLNLSSALDEVPGDTYIILNKAILRVVVNYAGTSFFTKNSNGYFQEHESIEKARDFLIKQYGTDVEIEVETSVRFSY